jgi:glycosyltransferase involved in cell wall biosynthesis
LNKYFDKFAFDQHPILNKEMNHDLGMVVVIPCFNEEHVLASLQSLLNCGLPSTQVEIIIVVNCSEKSDAATKEFQTNTHHSIEAFALEHSRIPIHSILRTELPKKHAGVGLARKIGMDEAAYRLEQSNSSSKLIICYDADSACDQNYLIEIEKQFISNPKSNGASIYYEHPLDGDEFEEEIYQGIINYELFLRYYNLGLNVADLPYSYHTVGSSMACTSNAYMKQGGMNKRKAGEDFYFIHKIIVLGDFLEINSTRVIPSPRISDRVPFGTGKAIGDWVDTQKEGTSEYLTYDFNSFLLIREFVHLIPGFYKNGFDVDKIPKELVQFLTEQGLNEAWNECLKNSTNFEQFEKRFFVWFGAFKVMKLLHFLRDEVSGQHSLFEQVKLLLVKLKFDEQPATLKEQLLLLRKIEREHLCFRMKD